LNKILKSRGIVRLVVEMRAIQISRSDIARFSREYNSLPKDIRSVIFLDEVGFDNQGMIRKYGYGKKGKALVVIGEFTRRARESLLVFQGVDGIKGVYWTEGTFDRHKFIEYCIHFATQSGEVHTYPGKHSVWCMDGASIHLDTHIVGALRSLGIIPLFIPAYCAFYDPIEFFFGILKALFRRIYVENSKVSLRHVICEAIEQYRNHDFTKSFAHCGYTNEGFDPDRGYNLRGEKKSKIEEL
jgi:hypothetical protein